MRAILILLALGFAACGGSDSSTSTTAVQWDLVEFVLPDAVSDPNPFDQTGTTVTAEVKAPDGRSFSVDGFVAQDFNRALVGGFEHLQPASELQWRVRFTPTEMGRWQWRTVVSDSAGERLGDWNTIEVGPPPEGSHGFVRRSPRDSRYLEYDDGTAFFAVGENLCWYNGPGTFAYDEWMARLAAEGANYIRLWMPSWAFGLEGIERDRNGVISEVSLGDYSARLDRAWQLDYVIELARRHGIQVMLSIQSHGSFSLTNNSAWVDNPYNAANGGPLAAPRDFFTDHTARELFRQRLRYIIARWGYATNVMSWELWNEVDLVDQPASGQVATWHREMASELRARDPYDHLISTSTGLNDALDASSPFNALWELEQIDFTQAHFYAFGGTAADFTQVFPRINNRLRRFGKPVLVAEAGVDFRGPAETLEVDPEGDGFHDLLWAAPFAEAFGSGMTWWWDNVIAPEDLYFHFGPLAKLVAGVDFPGEGFVAERSTVPIPDGRSVRVATLRGRDTRLGWVKNAGHLWHSPDLVPVAGARVSLGGLEGEWTGVWIDTRTGAESEVRVTGDGGAREIEVPTFSRDIAWRLNRVRESTTEVR